MQSINGKKITLTKGDTLKATVSIVDSTGQAYTPQTGDVIRFAMKRDYTDESVLVTKTIPNDTLLLTLASADTHSLEAGDYVYDIQITYANGDVDTFIDRGTMVLTEEVD